MNDETISERKHLLSNYINYFLGKTNFVLNNRLIELLEIDREFLQILNKIPSSSIRNSMNIKKSKSDQQILNMKNLKANNTLCKSFFDKDNNPLYLIEDLLEKLAIDKENICNSIKEFWDNLHTNNFPKIKEEYIRLLFGTKNEICDYGLISICGNVEENILGAETCLDLIAKFIDYEIKSIL